MIMALWDWGFGPKMSLITSRCSMGMLMTSSTPRCPSTLRIGSRTVRRISGPERATMASLTRSARQKFSERRVDTLPQERIAHPRPSTIQ